MGKADEDNRSNQLNPNNDAYHQSRGWGSRDDAFGDDRSGDRGVGWAGFYERYISSPIKHQRTRQTLFGFAEAAQALKFEVNFCLPYAMMDFVHQGADLVIDFTYLHCWQEADALKIIKFWEAKNQEGFRGFSGILVRFRGEIAAGL
ncbi:hypothetical protein PY254_13795 [Rhodanobacter sp. AS-Z3]|uniref:hypothetical protein n=1 Tax=Rhodanobacter sp. AS-Z3 TaxID=3031330 RepID=UPI00247AAAD6|nr:hypothetical protein [Rhodanobacter sp. AS-Z3]WEN14302.1 hypothetical protein PY254_13795 [Rhodanobacter sp. AS-Z3]